MEVNKQMIGPFELDSIVCTDAYKAIKLLPDKSVDLIYTDIPYLYKQGGSGSTLVSAKNNGRHYLGFDIAQKWVNVANDRLNNTDQTGQYSMFTI